MRIKLFGRCPAAVLIGLVTAGIVTGVCFMFFGNSGKINIGKSVTDIEFISLRLSGMRMTEEFEIKADGDKAELSYYIFSYANGQEEKVLKKRTECDTAELIDLLNSFDFVRWNGFNGKHPAGVLDGTMFSLRATLNGGQILKADGSENFPKHFREFRQWLYEAFRDIEETEVS